MGVTELCVQGISEERVFIVFSVNRGRVNVDVPFSVGYV